MRRVDIPRSYAPAHRVSFDGDETERRTSTTKPNMKNAFKRIRIYLAIALFTSPVLFSLAPPPDPCVQSIITGRVVTSTGEPAANRPVTIGAYDNGVVDLIYAAQGNDESCRTDYPSINARDTTDSEGRYSFSIGTERISTSTVDSLGVLVTLEGGDVIVADAFAESDTTSSDVVLDEYVSGSGCNCSTSPIMVETIIMYFFRDREITLP